MWRNGGRVAVASLLFLVALACAASPDVVAQRWADDNVDAAGEGVAAFVLERLGQEGLRGAIMRELAGEWIEDRIHEHLHWTYSAAVRDGIGDYVVIATARVDVAVDEPPIKGRLRVSLPFELRISGSAVIAQQVLLDRAFFDASLLDADPQTVADR